MSDDDAREIAERAERRVAERAERRAAAQRRHDNNRMIVGALLVLEGEAHPGKWRQGRPGDVVELVQDNGDTTHLFPLSMCADGHHGRLISADVALVAALRNGAAEALKARRRMLERHRPDLEATGRVIECARCFDAQENPVLWPCPDYEDLEVGLVMPHRVMVSRDGVAQLAMVECLCCGWSKTFGYARPATGGPVAERLAAVWGSMHLAGDPTAQLDPVGGEPEHVHAAAVRCPAPGCVWPLVL